MGGRLLNKAALACRRCSLGETQEARQQARARVVSVRIMAGGVVGDNGRAEGGCYGLRF